jgi:hypothetical protein
LGLAEFYEFREEDPDMERIVLFKRGKFAYAAIYAEGESGEEFGTTQRSIPSDQKTYWKIPSFTHVSVQIPDSRFPDYYEIIHSPLATLHSLREPSCSFSLCGNHESTALASRLINNR